MADSTAKATSKKGRQSGTSKFPLFEHKGRGYWCKTVLGKHRYFGKVAVDASSGEEPASKSVWTETIRQNQIGVS